MTRELYQRTEALEAKVQALLDEGVTDNQRKRIAERLDVEPESLESEVEDDEQEGDDE